MDFEREATLGGQKWNSFILKDATTSKVREEEMDHLEKITTSRGQKRNMTILKDL